MALFCQHQRVSITSRCLNNSAPSQGNSIQFLDYKLLCLGGMYNFPYMKETLSFVGLDLADLTFKGSWKLQ